jgi:putative PIN family toxin of toxin-antitoxin system
MRERRIVIDTNVVVAAFTSSRGVNRQVIRMCLSGNAVPLLGTALFREYESVLTRPTTVARCPLSADDREKLLDALLSVCRWVRVSFLWRPNLLDESDNHVMELAVAGGASGIVTNNRRDFLGGELVFPDIQIWSPSEFLEASERPS